eukprot:gene4054-7343_t
MSVSNICNECEVKKNDMQVCSACKQVSYCMKEHQKTNWPNHKKLCKQSRESQKSGFVKEILKEGNGTKPKKGDTVVVHYTGSLLNGAVFDSSRGRDVFEFTVGENEVIRGWDEGLLTFTKGERSILVISSDYGYGSYGAGSDIPGGATLVFDVELLDIVE